VARLGTLIGALLVALAGCGGEKPAAQKPPPPVRLSVLSPTDLGTVETGTVMVRGSVAPAGAQVEVQGRRAHVSGSTFSALVPLEEGPNVIDVAATARHRAAALTAFRITREQRVSVPDLTGVGADDAAKEVASRGLHLESERGGGFLDSLVPHGIAVCRQSPRPGDAVRRGTTVHVIVARAC
jgi:glucodextranase-like protein/PASTA domain-containing protein